jgi:Fe-S-cluster containining protein
LIEDKYIPKKMLYTLRPGEIVKDNIHGKNRILDEEIIKIRERPDGSCSFFEKATSSCSIYKWRPIQCRALKCWDTDEYFSVYREEKLKRIHLIKDRVILGLIEEHNRRCSYHVIEGIVKRIPSDGEGAIRSLMEILKFDYYLRPFVSEKLGIPENEMPFYFGRALIETISIYGLKVIKEKDNSFLLTLAGRP